MYFNGRRRGDDGGEHIPRLTSYVPQHDVLCAHETVLEAVTFACALRADHGYLKPGRARATERAHHSRRAIELCGLSAVANDVVGDANRGGGGESARGLSGGQRRRLSIAKALVAGASVCFMDEPTSGLSSSDAATVIETLSRLRRAFSCSFACVIHAPRARAFEAFTDLVLLARGGRCVFNSLDGGGGGAAASPTPKRVEDYLAALGHAKPRGVPIAEYALDLITPVDESESDVAEGRAARVDVSNDLWRRYEDFVAPAMRAAVDVAIARPGTSPRSITAAGARPHETRVTCAWRQFRVLFSRDTRLARRNRDVLLAIFGNAILMGVLVGVVFLDVRNSGSENVQYQLSFVFMVIVVGALNANAAVPVYVADAEIFSGETSENMYSVFPYAASKALTWGLINGLATCVLATITFVLAGFATSPTDSIARAGANYGRFLLAVLLAFFATDALMGAIASRATSHQAANAVIGGALGVLSLFNGFTANRRNLPTWLFWAQYASPFYWGFVAASVPLMRAYDPGGGGGTSDEYDYEALSRAFDFQRWMEWGGLVAMVAMTCAFRALVALALARK